MYKNYYTESRSCISNNKCNNNEENNRLNETCKYFQKMEDLDDTYRPDKVNNVFPKNPMLAQSYVPCQTMEKIFMPSVSLKMGTIFPELVSPYMPMQSVEFNNFLKKTNNIEMGCNK